MSASPATAATVVVIIPTYNEAANIVGIIGDVLDCACSPEVLVVDDASPDGTGGIVAAVGEGDPRVRLHARPGKAGLGAAYVDGMTHVLHTGGYDVVVQMDADRSHDPRDIDRLVEALHAADVAIGSRYVEGGGVEGWPLHRRLLSRAGNVYARLWLRLPVRDLTGGFKAWRTSALDGVNLCNVQSDGYAFQVETTLRASRAGAHVVEVPIIFRNRVHGSSKMNSRIALEALRVLPRLRRNARPG